MAELCRIRAQIDIISWAGEICDISPDNPMVVARFNRPLMEQCIHMTVGPELRIIASAWTDVLADFVACSSNELLIMSPWITQTAVKLISRSLKEVGPVKIQVLSRLDESDFMSGASHVEAFRRESYPPTANVEVRALPMLHAKMLVADRKRIIVGSANMTEGGLFRNHEVSVLIESRLIGNQCADVFFKLWNLASPLPDGYLARIQELLENSLPNSEDEVRPKRPRGTISSSVFRYVMPDGAKDAQRTMADLIRIAPPQDFAVEKVEQAMTWLTRLSKFIRRTEKAGEPFVHRLECLMYHPDTGVRATAIDRAGRSGNRIFLPRLLSLVSNPTEDARVRSAAAFALGLLGAPEAFQALASVRTENADLQRWARRSCFLLLDSVSQDDREWYLREMSVEDTLSTTELLRSCQMSSGCVSERLTKALIVEKTATGVWREKELKALVFVMEELAKIMRTNRKYAELRSVTKSTAQALGVAPGDLRHGPFSPALLRRLIGEGGVLDPGLYATIAPYVIEVERRRDAVIEAMREDSRFENLTRMIT